MIECTGNNDKNIYWPPMSRGHYRECLARTHVGTSSLCRCQKEYYETSFSSHTLLVTGPPPTHSKRNKVVQQNCVIYWHSPLGICHFLVPCHLESRGVIGGPPATYHRLEKESRHKTSFSADQLTTDQWICQTWPLGVSQPDALGELGQTGLSYSEMWRHGTVSGTRPPPYCV